MPNLIERADEWLMYHQGIPLTNKTFFAENLRVMVHAGLSMTEALSTLALQTDSKLFKKIITIVREDVEQGRSLSQGLAKFPKAFPPVFTNMVQIGEVSGTLEKVLEELSMQMRKDYELRSKVKGAMTYPVVILVAMVGITAGLVTFVLPRLLGVFKEFGDVQLPLATRILMWVSDFIQNNGPFVLVGIVVMVAAFISFTRTNLGRHVMHLLVIRAPIIGPIATKVNLARFCRTIAGLLHTDIPVVQAFEVTADVLGNAHYSEATSETAERIKTGETISSSLARYPKLYPPLVVQMVMVGERSGTVDTMLADIATFYEKQVDQTLDNLSSIIEPVLILAMGFMIGGIALAVITPIYSLTQSIAESN
jgi:type IV pilus assembly protein PilC